MINRKYTKKLPVKSSMNTLEIIFVKKNKAFNVIVL